LDFNEQDLPSSGKLRLTPTVNESSLSIGHTSSDTETLPLWIGQPFSPLTCSVEDSPVKTSPLPGNAQALMGQDQDYGLNTSEPFAHFDHATCLWKTYQVSLLTLTWDEFSETWPRAGTMRNGIVYQQVPLVPLTEEIASGLWPTVRAVQWKNTRWSYRKDYMGNLEEWGGKHFPELIGKHISLRWLEWHMGYPNEWLNLKP
jgi:hypothetical protein